MAEAPDTPKQEIKLFYCYAREDKTLRDELQVHLSGLRRQYRLTNWHDREILPGEQWEEAIDKHLSTADVILLLISPHFVDSDYCYSKEMQHALERHLAGTCCVIPILLRPTYWEETPFSTIQMLPTDARPITRWPDRDDAFHDVARGVGTTIKALLTSRAQKAKEWLKEGTALDKLKRYEEALAAYDQAIRLDPNDSRAYVGKGQAFYWLERYEEALAAYDQAIRLDSNNAGTYFLKGNALDELKRYEEALAAYDQAIRLDPNDSRAYFRKGLLLKNLERYEEALTAYEQAIRLKPNATFLVLFYTAESIILHILERHEEALAACDQAIRLHPDDAFAHHHRGTALQALGRKEEAQQAFDTARQFGFNG